MTGSGKFVRVLAVVGVAGAAAAAGTIGLAAAQTEPTTPPTTASAGQLGAGPAQGPGGHRGPAGRFGELGGIGGDVVHGEFVVPKDNGFETLDVQTGKVTDVSSSSITVVSDDDFTKTYAVTDTTLVNSARYGIGSIKSGNTVPSRHRVRLRRDRRQHHRRHHDPERAAEVRPQPPGAPRRLYDHHHGLRRPVVASRGVKWIVHGERRIYESEWMTLAPHRHRDPRRRAVRAPRGAGARRRRGRGRGRSATRRAAAVSPPLHHRHMGVGNPGWTHRQRRDAGRGGRPGDPRGDRLAPGPLQPSHHATHPNNGQSDLRFHLFLADSAEPVGPPTDPAESERVEWVPVDAVRRLVAGHEVPDGLSLTALLWWLMMGGRAT